MKLWNDYYLNRAQEILATQRTIKSAIVLMNADFPFRVTKDAIYNGFRRNELRAPSSYLLGVDTRNTSLTPPPMPTGQTPPPVPSLPPHVPGFDEEEIDTPPTLPRPWSSVPVASAPTASVHVQGESDLPPPESAGSLRRNALEAIERFKPLYAVIKRGAVHFRDLCDKLELSPKLAQKLVDDAIKAGVEISVVHDHIGIDNNAPQHVQDTLIAPVAGQRQKIAVISDTHLGSKYCMREQLKDFIGYAYNQGVRTILHPGDVLDGAYHHGVFELTHSGLEDQTRDLIETLPQLEGLSYHCITGNHDETFWKQSGVNVGRVIEAHFQDAGRNDIRFYGDRDAYLKVQGIVVHLWHPTGGGAYARSYGVQKKVESYTALKPQLLLTGHWHQYVHIFERGVHAIACPTFQGSMSRFSRSLKGTQAQGGLILSWDLTTHGTIRNFILEKRTYYENEKTVSVHNDMDGQAIPPAIARPGAVTREDHGVEPWHHKQR